MRVESDNTYCLDKRRETMLVEKGLFRRQDGLNWPQRSRWVVTHSRRRLDDVADGVLRALQTANLLAHAGELFCCGIARSGAYNRTLTPFGFQVGRAALSEHANAVRLEAGGS